MRVAIVGYGTMGRALAEYLKSEGHTITAIISRSGEVDYTQVSAEALAGCDVVIEFASQEGLEERLALYEATGTPAVIATTGWYDRLDEIRSRFSGQQCSIIYSGNFSLAVQLFFKIVAEAATLFNVFEGWDALIQEWFHAQKADSPSGTSHTLAQILVDHLDTKEEVESARLDRRRRESEIHIAAARGGYTAGEHSVVFDSPFDTITLTHTARSRQGYVAGAVSAAQWIIEGPKRGFYALEQMLDQVLSQESGDLKFPSPDR
jgi:4-hydroxy-tetrahydrodipicolinate reductase